MSEFGKGCAYCLGLFLAHEARISDFITAHKHIESQMKEKYPEFNAEEEAYSMWFYAAADHMFGLVIPDKYPDLVKKRLRKLKNKCLKLRLPLDKKNANKKDFSYAINEAKSLLMEIDHIQNIPCEKGDHE